jgi:ATP-dependent Lon protease
MSIAEANLDLPANFAGIVKVFPLPNLVLFPGVIQPLHIFEPRYRSLMRDALESDQLIAAATLKPGWEMEGGSVSRPEIYPTVCVGKIVTHAQLPDGRFNLLLCGARRARVIREIPAELPYRMADVNLVGPDRLADDGELSGQLRETILEMFRKVVSVDSKIDREAFSGLSGNHMPPGLLMDLIAFSCGASVAQQQKILETEDVFARGNLVIRMLRRRLRELKSGAPDFPPSFSLN